MCIPSAFMYWQHAGPLPAPFWGDPLLAAPPQSQWCWLGVYAMTGAGVALDQGYVIPRDKRKQWRRSAPFNMAEPARWLAKCMPGLHSDHQLQ